MCSTYFRQSHYYKTKDVQFLDLFKETDHKLVQPLSFFMFREGMFKTVLYIFENDIKEIIYNLQTIRNYSGSEIKINDNEYNQSQSQRSLSQQVNNVEGFNQADDDDSAENPPPIYDDEPAAEEIENLGQRLRFIHEY